MKKLMYKVRYLDTNGKWELALFSTKACAEMFYGNLIESGITASLNVWQWEVTVED